MNDEAGAREGTRPGPAGDEVQEARSEGGEVRAVPEMLGNNHAATWREHAVELGKQRTARLVCAKLVGGKEQEGRIDGCHWRWQAPKID